MSGRSREKLASLYRVRPRFLRSVNLERDFGDPLACKGYVLTDMIRNALTVIIEGLRPTSGRRAWRITGDYGSGKSSFGVYLAQLLSNARVNLPKSLKRVSWNTLGLKPPDLLPVLITGTREPIGLAIAKGLAAAIRRLYNKTPTSKAYLALFAIAGGSRKYADKKLVDAIISAKAEVVRQKKASGIFLVLDELGKFLEYEMLRPDGQDIYILQMIAEEAARSGKTPLVLLVLMHQSFATYAEHLNTSARKEWEKISGRFDELVFRHPLAQSAHLLSAALNLDVSRIPARKRSESRKCMQAAIDMGLFGPSPSRSALSSLAESLFPLSPTVLPILVRMLHRFGQNERSLFSFVLAEEPFGLQAFSSAPPQTTEFYRACDLYDYIRGNLSNVILEQSANNHWHVIDSTIQKAVDNDSVHAEVLKTVGILNLLNATDMLATENAILWCVAGSKKSKRREVEKIIIDLRKKKTLHFRGLGGGYCLWPHTSIDLDHLQNETLSTLGPIEHPTEVIKEYLDTRAIVARKHYIRSGNLRHFEIQYASIENVEKKVSVLPEQADGVILIVLTDSQDERSRAIAMVQTKRLKVSKTTMLAFPQPISNISAELEDARCWDWIAQNCMQLNSDAYAREEVERQRVTSRAKLNGRIHDLLNLRLHSGTMDIVWFWKRKERAINTGRDLVAFLSHVCDKEFSQAPHVRNELINRRKPSSAAAAARLRLIAGLLSNSHLDRLGMPIDKKPPEMSMYLSLLKYGGLHQKKADSWRLALPRTAKADTCNVRPAIQRIDDLLRGADDARVSISKVFEALRRPPYGVRDGLIPILLAVYIAAYRDKIALYEDGSFLPEIDERDFQRLTKEPQAFEMQRCSIEGVRAEVYEQLIGALKLQVGDRTKQDILAVVQPLCIYVADLPDYARSTKRISSSASQVRSLILGARDPVNLLFRDLPRACGCDAITPDVNMGKSEISAFAQELRKCIDELRSVYERLIDRVCRRLLEEFSLSTSVTDARVVLAERASHLLVAVTQQQLRSFCLCLADNNLSTSKWIESLASLVASKPPNRWNDKDEVIFDQELHHLVGLFLRLESMIFDTQTSVTSNGKAVRLTITRPNGEEVNQVVRYSDADGERLKDLKKDLSRLLANAGPIGMVAMSELIWDTNEARKT